MSELGYRVKRRERRIRAIQVAAGALGVFLVGYIAGYANHRYPVAPGNQNVPNGCVTLAIIPNDYLPTPSQVTVRVKNGSHRVGMASITAVVLGQRGFHVSDVGNFKKAFVRGTAQIRFGAAGKDAATLVSAYIANSELIQDDRVDGSVDVIIGQAFNQVLSEKAAHDVLNRPIASPSGPAC